MGRYVGEQEIYSWLRLRCTTRSTLKLLPMHIKLVFPLFRPFSYLSMHRARGNQSCLSNQPKTSWGSMIDAADFPEAATTSRCRAMAPECFRWTVRYAKPSESRRKHHTRSIYFHSPTIGAHKTVRLWSQFDHVGCLEHGSLRFQCCSFCHVFGVYGFSTREVYLAV
jgi:hypothetical protein